MRFARVWGSAWVRWHSVLLPVLSRYERYRPAQFAATLVPLSELQPETDLETDDVQID